MYVRAFGGSWFDHPFWKPRFVLKTEEEVRQVRLSRVPYVVIDDELGVGAEAQEAPCSEAPAASPRITAAQTHAWARQLHGRDSRGDARQKAERKAAQALVARSLGTMRSVFDGARLGRAVRIAEIAPIVEGITASIEHSPRTLLDIIRLKKKDEYTYFHSVAVCTLMVNVARHMDMSEREVRDYGLAGLLHDIGKMGIPDEVLNKAGRLTDSEFALVRSHPQHGHQTLLATTDVSDMALDVCLHHHEKVDGTGYPFGLAGDAVTIAARLGAICDVYDALTSERIYKEAWTPAEALGRMWGWQGHFDARLLFTFMQSIGIFPPGMLVELRSNRLGVVLDNRRRNSRPRVLAFYSTRERAFVPPQELTIGNDLSTDTIVAAANAEDWGLAGLDLASEEAVRRMATGRRAA